MSDELDPAAAIASLRNSGAECFDPVGLHFLEALSKRTQDQQASVKHLLDIRLSQALIKYQERFIQAQHTLRDEAAGLVAQALPDTSHFGELRQYVERLKQHSQQSILATLTSDLAKQVLGNLPQNLDSTDIKLADRPELKSIKYFRDTWSKLSVEKQLAQAIEQGPENAGPLNSHQLVLRSLAAMRDISPDYLNRFMSYIDTLLWLNQIEAGLSAKSTVDGEAEIKRKSSRSRSR